MLTHLEDAFTLRSNTKVTSETSDLIGVHQNFGPEDFALESKSEVSWH